MRFLSPEWLTAMHDAAAADPLPPGSSPIVVQHIIGDDGEGPTSSDPVTYAVVLAAPGAGTGVHPGRHPHPSLTFTSSYATARAIASGTSSAQAEFIAGPLPVGGDVRSEEPPVGKECRSRRSPYHKKKTRTAWW